MHFRSKMNDEMVLDIAGGVFEGGTKLILWNCHGGGPQQFVRDGQFIKVNNHNLGIDIPCGNYDNGVEVQIWDCNGCGPQMFNFGDGGEEEVGAADDGVPVAVLFAMVEGVYGGFEENFEEMVAAVEDADGVEGVFKDKINEIAAAYVEECEDLEEVPAKWEEVGYKKEVLEAFRASWLEAVTNAQQAAVEEMVENLYSACQDLREVQYMFEMGQDYKQEEWDAAEVVESEAMTALQDLVAEAEGMDVGFLEQSERTDPMEALAVMRAYATDEAGYIKSRADRVQAKGCRDVNEGWARVVKISACVGDNLDRLTFWYSDGTFRFVGRDFDDNTEIELEEGEEIVEVKFWKSKPGKCYGEGVRFQTINTKTMSLDDARKLDFLGKKTKGIFGGRDSVDQVFNVDDRFSQRVVNLNWTEEHNIPESLMVMNTGARPAGDWPESVDEGWRIEGTKLVYSIDGEERTFVGLPHETLKIENGRMMVDARLQD